MIKFWKHIENLKKVRPVTLCNDLLASDLSVCKKLLSWLKLLFLDLYWVQVHAVFMYTFNTFVKNRSFFTVFIHFFKYQHQILSNSILLFHNEWIEQSCIFTFPGPSDICSNKCFWICCEVRQISWKFS